MIIEHGTPEPMESIGGRMRFAIIGVVAVLAVGIGAVLGSLLVGPGAGSLSRAADYVPAGAVMYVEAQLDLPGAQRANLRSVLEHFPGIDADDLLGEALAGTLDDALEQGDAPFDYSSDIAPWFDGTAAIAVLDYPVALDPMRGTQGMPSMLVAFGARDPQAAASFAETARTELESQGAAFSSSEHDGTTIWSLEVPEPMESPMDVGFAYAVTNDQLLLGTGTDEIVAALESEGVDALPDVDAVSRLLPALPDERAGVMVLNSEAMLAQTRAQVEQLDPAMAAALAPYFDALPPYSVASLSFAGDAVQVDTVADLPDGEMAPANERRDLAAMVPADAIFFADASKLGTGLEQVITGFKAGYEGAWTPESGAPSIDQIEGVLGADLEELVSWIGAGAIAGGWDGEQVYVGLVLEAVDVDAAERRLSQLRALAELAASEGGSGITVSTDTVEGVEVTTIRIEESGAVAFGTPFAPALQYAMDGERVLIGFGDTFVETALTLDEADSLASNDRFVDAISRFGGDDNAGAFWFDVTALRTTVEAELGAVEMPGYAEWHANLEPLDYFAGVTRVDGDRSVSRLGLVLR